jgi:3-hydroxyisobutyrate dehydrogenase-like beta-hydroxyacid dehydrogenase
MEVAVIGLGLMGGTLARNLVADGHAVAGFDPVEARRAEHAARGGLPFDSVGEAVAGREVAVLSLPNGTIMLDVVAEIAASGPPGMLVADTTTGAPRQAIEAAARLAAAGIGFVDATVSGNSAQAASKDVIFMVGGDADGVARAAELLGPLGRRVHHVGPVGSGAAAKLVVNHILSINRTGLAEGLTVAEKAGIEPAVMLEILSGSAAYSKAMDIWGARMVAADHDPPASRVRQSHKDSRLINAFAEEVGASHALVEMVSRALVEAEEGGLGEADNAAVMEVMRRRAGIGRIDG